jgi:hypothetical protein
VKRTKQAFISGKLRGDDTGSPRAVTMSYSYCCPSRRVCGAHIGVYIREALSLGAKLVVAVEPALENLECLRRNFATEIAAGRVIVYPKGVWDREEVLT